MEWKQIEDCPNYEVGSHGKVRNRITGLVLSPSINKKGEGYEMVILTNKNIKRVSRLVHRLVGVAFIPNPENKPFINHIDEIKLNNCVENLEWSTVRENNYHSMGTGKILLKISDEQVRQMRAEYVPYKMSARKLAKKYGLSFFYTRDILRGRVRKFASNLQ